MPDITFDDYIMDFFSNVTIKEALTISNPFDTNSVPVNLINNNQDTDLEINGSNTTFKYMEFDNTLLKVNSQVAQAFSYKIVDRDKILRKIIEDFTLNFKSDHYLKIDVRAVLLSKSDIYPSSVIRNSVAHLRCKKFSMRAEEIQQITLDCSIVNFDITRTNSLFPNAGTYSNIALNSILNQTRNSSADRI